MHAREQHSYDNKPVSCRLFQDVCTAGNLDVISQLVTEEALHRDRDVEEYHGPDGIREWIGQYRKAFPDMQVIIEDQVAEGDKVATRWTTRGTHRGEIWCIPPTGKTFAITGVTIDRFVDGRIAESLESWDAESILRQLGVKKDRYGR
jgi:steroid delta-isomerase-like uncharacterized protein